MQIVKYKCIDCDAVVIGDDEELPLDWVEWDWEYYCPECSCKWCGRPSTTCICYWEERSYIKDV